MTIMPVYFLSTGLRTNWETGGPMVFGAAALLLVAAVAGKLAGVHIAGRLLRWPPGDAALIGWLLQTKALIMIIFSNVLLDRGVITADAFTALLLMALGSTMLTMPIVLPRLARMRAEGRLPPLTPEDRSPPAPCPQPPLTAPPTETRQPVRERQGERPPLPCKQPASTHHGTGFAGP